MSIIPLRFGQCLDMVTSISKPIRENKGEDSFFCSKSCQSAIVCVCDGCGGLGARKYESFKKHTGAYMASRIVSGAVRDWYKDYYQSRWEDARDFCKSIDSYIKKGYEICTSYATGNSRVSGSMVRSFPTTLALAYAELCSEGIRLHVLWAGDSRVYILDEDGLSQLSVDDTDITDAFENLLKDGVMTNVLSSDGRYMIHSKTIYINKPTIVFSATDGCFGYMSSPMEFEDVILNAFMDSCTPKEFKEKLYRVFSEYAGDDFSMCMMSFFFGDYENTKSILNKRHRVLYQNYICQMPDEYDEAIIKNIWIRYKVNYEKYINGE